MTSHCRLYQRRDALKMWKGNRRLARKWLHAVSTLRSGNGWILDGAPGWRDRYEPEGKLS